MNKNLEITNCTLNPQSTVDKNLVIRDLFVLCPKALSFMIYNVEVRGELKGLRLCRAAPMITHLFFADDSLFFLKASKRNLLKILEILELYGLATGQKINFEKSSITFRANLVVVLAEIETITVLDNYVIKN